MTKLTFVEYDRDKYGRIETGPLQIGDDWPGIFIRGDQALGMASWLEFARDELGNENAIARDALSQTIALLSECNVRNHE